jgi:predicted nucleic acid-binding protein
MVELILLDTNVISAIMRPSPTEPVMRWFTGLPMLSFRTTAINEAEIRYGIARLPEGGRKRDLTQLADEFFLSVLEPLAFGHRSALHYARIASGIYRKGFKVDVPDVQIAAIAAAVGAAIATRNVDDFKHCGVTIINPWQA